MADLRPSLVGTSPLAAAPAGPSGSAPQGGAPLREAFAQVLDAKLDGELRFSAHAQARLKSREMPLSEEDCSRLAAATSEAGRKGSREALLLMGGMGFIVSVPNRTVITALDSSRLDGGIITGIDAAVLVPEA
jgi:flagellar operon protein